LQGKDVTGFDLPAVAVIADAHFQGIDSDYGGAGLRRDGKVLAIRSWADTRKSSRVFNESEAALIEALEQIKTLGLRHVVLLGDYTDNGQIEATQRCARLLARYRDGHGIAFYALPGNHDVFGPLGKHQSTRFVTGAGKSVLVTSNPKIAATEPDRAVLTRNMYCEGMPQGLMPMAEFGYFKAPHYHHWETPFGLSDAPDHRMYTAKSSDGIIAHRLMDASYLVEPEPGLWLLMIDANVFEPRSGQYRPGQKAAFIDPTDAGWNALLRVKPFLIDWISDVCRRADTLGKNLLTFSHYPTLDPFDDRDGSESALFGETEIVRRRPSTEVADTLIHAGLKLHFSGHYHVNAVSVCDTQAGQLKNISVPSLVAFPPGFKVLQPTNVGVDIKTVSLGTMPVDPGLMALYRDEVTQRGEPEDPALGTATHGAFLYRQMHSRLTHHLLSAHWPADIAEAVKRANAADLACLFLAGSNQACASDLSYWSTHSDPIAKLAHLADKNGLDITNLRACSMTELIGDWYCLRQSGAMAGDEIALPKRRVYRFLAQEFGDPAPTSTDRLSQFFAVFLSVLGHSLDRTEKPHP
jgi:3',5'-cyclic AMP phosphodiesterase CpdA